MFAGPHGSGKSRLKQYLPEALLGVYLNADDIEKAIREQGLLMEAIRNTNRAYIFDNSTDSASENHTWLAEITEGRKLELRTDRIPSWFKRAV